MQKEHGTTSYFSCNLCECYFLNQSSFEQHLDTEHGIQTSVICNSCDRLFLDRSHLDDHICASLSSVSNCDKTNSDNDTSYTHYHPTSATSSSMHLSTELLLEIPPEDTLPVCDETSSNQWKLNLHKETVQTPQYFTCVICNYLSVDENDLNVHLQSVHANPDKFPSQFCSSRFASPGHHYQNPEPFYSETVQPEDSNATFDTIPLDDTIDQLDGNTTINDENNPSSTSLYLAPITESRQAPFQLNQMKQTKAIIEDLEIKDFEITVKNNSQNVTRDSTFRLEDQLFVTSLLDIRTHFLGLPLAVPARSQSLIRGMLRSITFFTLICLSLVALNRSGSPFIFIIPLD